jgi:hypothetical protein
LLCTSKYLRYVNWNGCLGLTSACLQPLFVSCKYLKSLKVKNCHRVTFDTIKG